MRQAGLLSTLGELEGDSLRYKASQAALLDLILESQGEVELDDAFAKVRSELASFEKIEAIHEPPGFQGELREYQREGLGWIAFLERFGFGGCLADDMGLGKTVLVLAWLEGLRQARAANQSDLDPVARVTGAATVTEAGV